MISIEKVKILAPLQKLPKNVVDLGKLIVATGFEKLPKVQKISQSGHTVSKLDRYQLGWSRGWTVLPIMNDYQRREEQR